MLNQTELSTIFSNNQNYSGLSAEEAEKRLQTFGYNSRPEPKHKSRLRRMLSILGEPMIVLLLIATAVYFFLGDTAETIVLLCSIVPIIAIEFFQEQKTDEAIRALDKMMVQYSEVYRDNKTEKIESKFLVPGDLVYLTAGDRVPADGVVYLSPGLMVDESMLTGESIAVVKNNVDNIQKIEETNKLWQGTMITQGEGKLLILDTGVNTAYGKLGNLLENIKTIKTPLQAKIHHLVKKVAIAAIVIAVVIGIIVSIQKGITAGLLSGITMAMSLIPEEFPVVFSVFLIMGVWRMTKKNALTREMAMVETLGSATVICTDKTGTLTEGKMSLEKIFYLGKSADRQNILKQTAHFAPFFHDAVLSLEQVAIDPMEIEMQHFAGEMKIDVEKLFRQHTLINESPFDAKTKMVHHLWEDNEKRCIQYSAGAPEALIAASTLSAAEKTQIEKNYEEMAGAGYRVIAIGKRIPQTEKKITVENLEFLGLIAMSDPPRAGVKEAINLCQKAGIRVLMITGDNKLTAHNIAESIDMRHREDIVSGSEMESLSPAAMQEIVRRHDIFTRVHPEQKYAIVEALQANGEIVAMTGDGVNDAPALKKANIGIAMGQKGTEVARAAAGIVLLDDNFSTIVNAIKEGRRIYDNLRHAFVFLFSFNLPIVLMAFVPLLFKQELIFFPIHIIFLELFCDPASVLGFEHEAARHNLMNEPPRPVKEPIVNPHLWRQVIVQGMAIAIVTLGLYFYSIYSGTSAETGRTLAFGSLVISQILIIIFTREWQQVKSNKIILIIIAATLASLLLILLIPGVLKLFHFVSLTNKQWFEMFIYPLLVMPIVGRIFQRPTLKK